MSLGSEQLERFVRDLAARPELWRAHVQGSPTDRVYTRIWSDADVDVWLICWSATSDTGFHDHDASAASIAVLEGAIIDERLRIDGPPQARVHHAGATLNIAPTAIHRVTRASDGTAVTLHAYSPPLVRQGTYRVTPDGRLEREAQSGDAELGTPAAARTR